MCAGLTHEPTALHWLVGRVRALTVPTDRSRGATSAPQTLAANNSIPLGSYTHVIHITR
jgi:hypothetical protein